MAFVRSFIGFVLSCATGAEIIFNVTEHAVKPVKGRRERRGPLPAVAALLRLALASGVFARRGQSVPV
jgi:hypothetical protein